MTSFFPWGHNYLLNPRGMMAIEVYQNKEISEEGKNRGRIGSAIRQRRAKKLS